MGKFASQVLAMLLMMSTFAVAQLYDVQISAAPRKLDEQKDRSGNVTVTTKEIAYKVTVENRAFKTIPELQIKYMIFYVDPKPGSREKPIEAYHKGSETLTDLASNRTATFETIPFKLTKEELDAGWYWVGSGSGPIPTAISWESNSNPTSDHPELLPLLEYVLRELFEERTREGVLAYATYEKLGGVVGALAKKAETVYQAQSSEAKAAFPSLMRALVTVSDTGEERVVRRRPAIKDVAETPAVRVLMDAFVSGRLLTTDGDGESATVSVAHEALFRVWDRARGWVEQNRDFLRVRARVASRMEEGSALLEGDPLLDEACYQLRQNIQSFSAREREFIERCAGAVARARTRRRNVRNAVLAGMFVLTVLATAAAFWATIKQREAWRAATRVVSLLAQADIDRAISLLETPDSALALPYLIRASESSVGDDFALKRLWHVLAYRLWPVATSESGPFLSGVSQLRVLPNGKEALAVTTDGRIHVIDVWSGKASRASLNAGDDIRAIDFSPDGSLVAAGCKNGAVKIWSLASESSDPMAE